MTDEQKLLKKCEHEHLEYVTDGRSLKCTACKQWVHWEDEKYSILKIVHNDNNDWEEECKMMGLDISIITYIESLVAATREDQKRIDASFITDWLNHDFPENKVQKNITINIHAYMKGLEQKIINQPKN